jgi:hypothetical protein
MLADYRRAATATSTTTSPARSGCGFGGCGSCWAWPWAPASPYAVARSITEPNGLDCPRPAGHPDLWLAGRGAGSQSYRSAGKPKPGKRPPPAKPWMAVARAGISPCQRPARATTSAKTYRVAHRWSARPARRSTGLYKLRLSLGIVRHTGHPASYLALEPHAGGVELAIGPAQHEEQHAAILRVQQAV